jgi:hypothetical protein
MVAYLSTVYHLPTGQDWLLHAVFHFRKQPHFLQRLEGAWKNSQPSQIARRLAISSGSIGTWPETRDFTSDLTAEARFDAIWRTVGNAERD